MPPPEFQIDGFLEKGGLSAVIGAPGSGKSFAVLDMICCIAAGLPWKGKSTERTRVIYVAGEGVSGTVQRVQAWEEQHGVGVGTDLMMIPEATLLASTIPNLWEWLAASAKANGAGLIVFDTLARMSVGLDENSAQDMGRAVGIFDKLRKHSGAGVMLVHHTNANGTGRGSSALLGALDTELTVKVSDDDEDDERHDGSTHITVTPTKQKNAPIGESVDLYLRSGHGSVIVTDASGGTGDDPFSAMIVRPKRAHNSVDELAARAYDALEGLTMGVSRSDLADLLSEDRSIEPPRKFELIKALDRALATGILQMEGAKYVRGFNTLDHAREKHNLIA